MDLNHLVVLSFFFGTIGALIFSNLRPSTVFALAVLGLLVAQQITFDEILVNLTNKGLITLILLLLVSSAIDKTAFIKRLGRKLVTANFTQSYWRLFGLTFFSSALLNNTAIVASLIVRSYFRRYGHLNRYVYQPDRRQLFARAWAPWLWLLRFNRNWLGGRLKLRLADVSAHSPVTHYCQ